MLKWRSVNLKKSMKLRSFSYALFFSLLFAGPVLAADFISSVQNGLFKQNAILTTHFRFEYSDLVADQADEDTDGIPDSVEILADAAERSWDILIDEMDYEEPNDSGARVLVILDDTDEYLFEGALGVTTVQSNDDAIIAINPWLSEDYLQITMAHEFFHAIQFGYGIEFSNYGQGVNWAESTAVWVEEVVYDASNDYVNYYDDFFSYVDYSIFASVSPSDTLYTYALNIWPIFLSEYYNDTTIKVIWENYFESSNSYADNLKIYDAVNDYVTAQGDDLGEVFQQFTLWNLALENYEEGDSYPGIYYLDGFTGEEYVNADELFAPALFGTNYLYFQNPGESHFYFHLLRPTETRYAVSLVPLDGASADLEGTVSTILSIGEEMSEEMSLELAPDQDVMVVLSPLEIDFNEKSLNEYVFDEGYLYSYLADFGTSVSANVETDGQVAESAPDEKAGEDSTQTEEVRKILTLSLKDYDQSSVTLTWNRITEEEIAGYQLSYGTSSEVYDASKLVDVPHITIKTVSDLIEGQTYYFQLEALDVNGDRVGEPSTELAVTLEKRIFTDLSYLDVHFDSVASLTEMGVFQGYPDGSFKPEGAITRAELVKILVEGQDITPDETQYNSCFTDVAHEWYAKYLCYAKAQDWIRGYADGSFRPNSTVSKVEALKILFEIYGVDLEEGTPVESLPYVGLPTNEWYSIYVWEAAEQGILEETPGTDFLPHKGRTRAEMAEELYRYLVINELAR